MKILIDTNILDSMEILDKVIKESFQKLHNICNKYQHQLLIYSDILEPQNINKQGISISKVNEDVVFDFWKVKPNTHEILDKQISSHICYKESTDNFLLNKIIKEEAHILITENREIHREAKKMGLGTNVHYVQQALAFLQMIHRIKDTEIPSVEDYMLSELNINDNFFDSLREDYSEFNNWFFKKSLEGRMSWILKDKDSNLSGLLIYKVEKEIKNYEGNSIAGQILKLCTFKVSERQRGRRIGEQLLKKAFDYCIKSGYEYIYITFRLHKHPYLSDICEDFGFYNFGMCEDNRDIIYIKEIPQKSCHNMGLSPFEFYRKYHPIFQATQEQSKFLLPIPPLYYRRLFPKPELGIQQFLFKEKLPIAGDTIKKVYLTHRNLMMRQGDLLLVYRSYDKQEITILCIVEEIYRLKNIDDLLKIVSKRTIYSREEITHFAKKETMVIFFREIRHFTKPIKWHQLTAKKTFRMKIPSIDKIEDTLFKEIITSNQIPYDMGER